LGVRDIPGIDNPTACALRISEEEKSRNLKIDLRGGSRPGTSDAAPS
jgi:hypothetical protein